MIVSPDGRENSVKINQDAHFSLVNLDKEKQLTYTKYEKENGVYFFALNGSFKVNGESLSKRDGFGVENTDKFELSSQLSSEVLIMEVPMCGTGRS